MNTPRRPFGQLVMIVLMLVSLMAAVPLGVSAQGNSDAAHLCQQGGWEDLQGSDGTLFANQDECVSYAAQGGMLITRTLPSIIVSVAPAVHGSGEPGYMISGTGTNFTPNAEVSLVVQFHDSNFMYLNYFTADSQGDVTFNLTPFVVLCRYQGFDFTAKDTVTNQFVTTTVTTVPCG